MPDNSNHIHSHINRSQTDPTPGTQTLFTQPPTNYPLNHKSVITTTHLATSIVRTMWSKTITILIVTSHKGIVTCNRMFQSA